MFVLPDNFTMLFKTVAGSQLYGTSTPESDYDERGVFMAPREYWMGFKKSPEQFEDKTNDTVYYEFRKFLKLCLDCNPNMVELLFVPEPMWLQSSEMWEYVVFHRNLFLSTKARHTFSGYAHSQLKRLKNHKKWLDGFVPTEPAERLSWSVWKDKRNPKRFALEQKFGYDTKHAMHLYRLMEEGKELLLTGNITLPRPDARLLVQVREGLWTYEELMERVNEYDHLFEKWEKESPLPRVPDTDGVHRLCEYVALNMLFDGKRF
jgi:predicted nucleotidyltransferase